MQKLPSFLENPNPKRYLEDDYLVLDFETTNKDKGAALNRANRLILATWVDKLESTRLGSGVQDLQQRDSLPVRVQSKFGDEYHQEELADAVGRAGFIVAHHSKFEIQWLQRIGVEIGSKLVWDTMLAEFVIAGNRRRDLSLQGTAKRYGLGSKVSRVDLLIQGGICPSEIPEEWLLEYGCADTELCHQIFLKQRPILVEMGLLNVFYTRCLLTPVLADIELRGMQLDAAKVKEEYDRVSAECSALQNSLDKRSGGINWRSGKQVGEYVYGTLGFSELERRRGVPDRTDGDKPKTDGDTIGKLKAATLRQKEFLREFKQYRILAKKLENLEKLKNCCEIDGGRLHAQYNQAVAGTHRLTSSGLRHKVQFQNIDVTIKSLFAARSNGWLVGEADGVQLEFRVAAHLGRDSVALADIRDPNFDIHWQTAEAITGKARTSLNKDIRRDSKQYSFRPLYGGSGGDPGVRKYIKFFQERYKGIYDTQTGWTYEVLRDKKLRTETGLIFYWPDTKLEEGGNGRGYIRNRTAIFNYPVQSLATADIIPISLVYFWHRIKAEGLEMFLVNTVHDSIIAEVPPSEDKDFRNLANRCFTVDCFRYLDTVYGITFSSPLGAETKVGKHWSDGKEAKFDLDPEAANGNMVKTTSLDEMRIGVANG